MAVGRIRELLVAALLVFIWGCGEPVVIQGKLETKSDIVIDLDKIRERKKLVALCRYDPNNYFIYKGKPMGYEYEMLRLLADYLDVELEIKVPRSWSQVFNLLKTGKGDIIGANMSITLDRLRMATFTEPYMSTRQMLVQRKPENWRDMKIHEIEKELIRNPLDLIGREVHVAEGSAFEKRLENLSHEIGGIIEIVKVGEDMDQAELIRQVAEGDIALTLGDENVVSGYNAIFPILDSKTPVSFPQRIAWAVRKNAPQLLAQINDWMEEHKQNQDPRFNLIYNKYFKNRSAFKERLTSGLMFGEGGSISPFDSLFKSAAKELNWNWMLLASQAFQESRFEPNSESWVGAVGLMQVMPTTAELFKIEEYTEPEDNLKVAVKFLQYLEDHWKDMPEGQEKLKFILASYNAGPGHIRDAQRLAKKYGKDPEIWEDNVEEYLLKKAEPDFYYDPVVKYGYCRGSEAVKYVREILWRYNLYQNLEEQLAFKEKKEDLN